MLMSFFILNRPNLRKHPYTLMALEMMMHAIAYATNHFNFIVYKVPFWWVCDITFFGTMSRGSKGTNISHFACKLQRL
jgi:hypothetical protein